MALPGPILFLINFRLDRFLTIALSYLMFRQPLEKDTVRLLDMADTGEGPFPFALGSDSYSHNGACYCFEVHAHEGLGEQLVDTPLGQMTVDEACARAGPGPGPRGNPLYNDIQCGNGPPGPEDEVLCPGRSEYGHAGCHHVGPTWVLN